MVGVKRGLIHAKQKVGSDCYHHGVIRKRASVRASDPSYANDFTFSGCNVKGDDTF